VHVCLFVFALRFYFYFVSLYFSLNCSPMDTQCFCSLLFSFMNSLHSVLQTFLNIQPSVFSRKQGVCVCARSSFPSIPALLCVIFSFLLLAVSGTVCRVIEGSAYTGTRLYDPRKSAVLIHREKPESLLFPFFFPACRGHLNAQTHTHAVKMKHSLRD
jgi:hypothetical protein